MPRPSTSSEPPARPLGTKLRGLFSVARTMRFGEAVRHISHRANEEFHERRLGIRTRGFLSGVQLGHQSPEFGAYLGAPYPALWRCFAQVSIRQDRDALLDIGSGMGRALIAAATKPFRRVIGVEISPALADRARENLRHARTHLKCEVSLDVADARGYLVPDDITVIHIFNPFVGDTLARVVGNIRSSLQRRPRQLTIIYGNPARFEAMFFAEGWLSRRFFHTFYPNIDYAVYDCRAAGGPR